MVVVCYRSKRWMIDMRTPREGEIIILCMARLATKEARAFLTPLCQVGWDRIKLARPWPVVIMDDERVSWWAGLGGL